MDLICARLKFIYKENKHTNIYVIHYVKTKTKLKSCQVNNI